MTPAELQGRFELDVYGKRGLTLVRGEGARLWNDSGREYLDCMSGHGALNLGHSHPRIFDAIVEQAGRLLSAPGSFYHPERARLMARLVELAPAGLERVFLCNSGTESTEAALKLARLATGRSRFVAFKRSFHGRSFGAMSVSFKPEHHRLFAPVLPGVSFLSFNATEGLDEALTEDVAAVVIELVQGEGGVHVAEPAFVDALVRRCRERGILLVVDEVQTGFGRTGTLFACERYRLEPDVLCLAKSLGGGLPMGAVLVSGRVEVSVGVHGSTFGGNPLACAVANRVLDLLTEGEGELLRAAAERGGRFLERLRRIDSPIVQDVRGLGLLVGVQLGERASAYLEALASRGVLALAAGPKVLRFLPPLVMSEEDLLRVADAFEDVLAARAERLPERARRP